MCVVSSMGDHFQKKWTDPQNPLFPYTQPGTGVTQFPISPVSAEEFNALKKEVEEMKAILIRAKLYDIKNNEPNCEMEDKVELLKRVAKLFGVDLSEVFGEEKQKQ